MSKVIYVNSNDRTSGTLEDFVISKTIDEFEIPPKRVKVVSASIPYTWYNIPQNIVFDINEPAGFGLNTVDLLSGYYTGNELALALDNKFTSYGGDLSVAYNSTYNNLVFKNYNANPFDLVVPDSLAKTLIGFNIGTTSATNEATITSSPITSSVIVANVYFRITELFVATIKIPNGIYTGPELVEALQTEINNITINYNYKVEYRYSTSEIIISCDNNFSITIPNAQSATAFGFPLGATASALMLTARGNEISATENRVVYNRFELTDTGGPYIITIPESYYTGITFADALANAMNDASLQTYTVDFDTTFNTLTITGTSTPFSIEIFDKQSADLYGLPIGTTTDTDTTPNNEITTLGIQLSNDFEIFVCSDLVSGSDNGIIVWKEQSLSSLKQNQILARVPINSCFNTYLDYKNDSESPYYLISQRTFSGDDEIKSIRFYLKFPSGLSVNLNGYPWSIELLFDFNENF